MNTTEWINEMTETLGMSLCLTLMNAHNEALVGELGTWLEAYARPEVIAALHMLHKRLEVVA